MIVIELCEDYTSTLHYVLEYRVNLYTSLSSPKKYASHLIQWSYILYSLVQIDHPDEGEEEESTDRDVSTAPITFGNSDDENDYNTARQNETEGSEGSATGSKKSSLSDRLRDWEEDDDEEDRQATKESKKESKKNSLPVRKRPLSSVTADTSKKRREVSNDDESPEIDGRDRGDRGGDEDTEATQPQSQIRTRPDKVRKLQKKETKGRSDESDDELFSDRTESLPVGSEDTIAQATSFALSSGPSAGWEGLAYPVAKAVANSLRSRTTIVDSDED